MKIPKYRFVYEDLLKQLESKKFKYGQIIPTEKNFVKNIVPVGSQLDMRSIF